MYFLYILRRHRFLAVHDPGHSGDRYACKSGDVFDSGFFHGSNQLLAAITVSYFSTIAHSLQENVFSKLYLIF